MPSTASHVRIETGSQSGTSLPFGGSGPGAHESNTVLSTPRQASEELSPVELLPASSELAARLFPGQSATVPDAVGAFEGVVIGHFALDQRIGTGGMGTVFLAEDERLQRPVALKILAPSQTADPAAVQRFQNEARAAARLDHDHVARVFYYGEDQGLHYIAFEYVQGVNLRDVIRQRGRIEPADAVSYAVQLAAALCHTSACGVVHRDIKPSNIIITPQGKVKLVDLGLARKESLEESAQLTVAGTTLGTFDYIAPEQAKDPRNVDVRSDIYSLGCTLYHMVTGVLPFPEGTVLQRLLDHQDKEPPDPALKNRRVSVAFSAVIRKMMAADPRRRHHSAEELLRDLLAVAAELGLQAVPADSAVMAAWRPGTATFWQLHGAWIVAMSCLIAAASALQLFPGLLQRLASEPNAQSEITLPLEAHTGELPRPAAVATRPSQGTTSPNNGSPTNPLPIGPTAVIHPFAGNSPRALQPMPLDGDWPPSLVGTSKLPTQPFENEVPLISNPIIPPSTLVENDVPSPFKMETPRPTGADPVVATTGTNPVVTPPVVPETALEPSGLFLIAGTGKSYPTLEAACADARDQASIELHFDGRSPQVIRPLRIVQKRLTIHAARGRRPTLVFAPTDQVVDASLTRMLTVMGGALTLQNVGLELRVPEHGGSQGWTLFSLMRCDRLKLSGVTATIINPRRHQATLIEVVPPLGESLSRMGTMKDGAPLVPMEVLIERSILRGETAGIRLRENVPLRIEIEQSLAAVAESMLLSEATLGGMQAPGRVTVQMTQSTLFFGAGLLHVASSEDLTGRPVPIEITARQSIFSCPADKPLIEQHVALESMENRKSLVWIGDGNLFDDVQTLWLVMAIAGNTPPQRWDFTAWRTYWGQGETTGAAQLSVPWARPWRKTAWSEITRDDARYETLPDTTTVTIDALPGVLVEMLPGDPQAVAPAVPTAPLTVAPPL